MNPGYERMTSTDELIACADNIKFHIAPINYTIFDICIYHLKAYMDELRYKNLTESQLYHIHDSIMQFRDVIQTLIN